MSAAAVPSRPLGPAMPPSPVVALGSWNTWDRMDDDETDAVIRRAVEVGAAHFDVAHYDMGPHAEQAVTDLRFAAAVARLGLCRDDYQLCGKLWLWDWPRTRFREQLLRSAERAGVERFDAVVVGDFLEAPDPAEVVGAVQELVEEGLFPHWGVNNWPIETLLAVQAAAASSGAEPPRFAQLKYSPVRRAMAEGEPYGAQFAAGVLGLQASDMFEGGVLLGRTPTRKIGADVGGIRAGVVAAAPRFAEVGAGLGASPAQLALAFCLSNPRVTGVLLGVSRLAQLEENLGAFAVLERHGAAAIRAAVAEFRLDTEVRADGHWQP